jgi:signal transduction histidine kinase
MMEGFDRDWIHCGTRRFANYTHIDPGDYVFRVKASNNDGVWNEAGIAVRVIITPPFWGTLWFRGLMGAMFVAGLIALYRSRIGSLERKERAQQEFTRRILTSQEQERARIAGELHDSLVQNLLVAKNRSLMGLRRIGDRGAVERELNEISGAMTSAIDEVREIAHNLRPYQLDRLGLTRAILSLGDTLGQTSGIRFALSVENIDPYFSSEQSILLFRIIQEAANNILRHSEASEGEIGIRKDPASVTILIRDNGKGLPADRATTRSFGLSGISQRVRMLGGRFSVESSHGQGTTLRIDIPVGKEAR